MNVSAIKMQIFIIQLVDWVLLLSITGGGVYGTLHSQAPFLVVLAALFGLGVFSMYGHWSVNKVALLRHQLAKLEGKKK